MVVVRAVCVRVTVVSWRVCEARGSESAGKGVCVCVCVSGVCGLVGRVAQDVSVCVSDWSCEDSLRSRVL